MDISDKFTKHYFWIVASLFFILALAMGLAFILPARENVQDFITLYAADFAILHHVPLYDTPTIISLMIDKLSLRPDFTVFPYPYPPWFALSTFFLAFLPPQKAVNAWMFINIAVLFSSAFLLTAKWKPIPRILAIMAALVFIPSIGLIVVGQYSALVLLGATLFLYAAQREDAPLTALGLLLMTFKPHLGLFLLPVSFFWLVFQKTPFARRAIWMTLAGGLLLALLGFLADSAWPVTYVRSLMSYTTIPGVANRDLSASFSALLVKMLLGYGSAFWATCLSVVLIAIMLALFWRFKLFAQLELLVAGCVLLTLLGDPYMFNYDYVLILLPLAFLARHAKSIVSRFILGIVYFVPWLSLILERNANILYAVSAIFLFVMLIRQSQNESIKLGLVIQK